MQWKQDCFMDFYRWTLYYPMRDSNSRGEDNREEDSRSDVTDAGHMNYIQTAHIHTI